MVTDATNTDQELLSDLPIPPGETVLEGIEYHGMSMRELAEKIELSPLEVDELIKGEMPMTQGHSRKTRECAGHSRIHVTRAGRKIPAHSHATGRTGKPHIALRILQHVPRQFRDALNPHQRCHPRPLWVPVQFSLWRQSQRPLALRSRRMQRNPAVKAPVNPLRAVSVENYRLRVLVDVVYG